MTQQTMASGSPHVAHVDDRLRPGARELREASEEQIHRAVVRHLELRARPGVTWFHPANGGSRHKGEAGRFKALGVRAGVPDLVIVAGGRTYALEIKAHAGRVSPSQEKMHSELRAAGAEVAISHGLDEALAQLERWALLGR